VTPQTDLLHGTLDLLIMRTLLLQPDHGLGITRRIQQITRGTFEVKPGSLFPALHRLEERGWLASHWGESENRRRAKYYTLTAAGRRHIDTELTNWQRIVTAIGWAIDATS
jgi:PadR family transcriptional regulator, regulatory protein PadR